MKTLFHNAKILTGDGNWTPIENGYLVVEDDRISDLGSGQPNIAAEVKRDCGGVLLMPGLYNAHSHTPMSLLRGIGTGLTLQEWLFDKILAESKKELLTYYQKEKQKSFISEITLSDKMFFLRENVITESISGTEPEQDYP